MREPCSFPFAVLATLVAAVGIVAAAGRAAAQQRTEVPVTIKELDVAGAMREFQAFHQELARFRDEISEGKKTAAETAQILEELQRTATAENAYNEGKILEAIRGYVDGVIGKQVELVDFLESQRYRISYYANQMAASVRPEDLVLLFGTEPENVAAVRSSVRNVEDLQQQLATFVDGLPPDQFDRGTFRPSGSLPAAKRRELDSLLYRYQQARNAQDLAKNRLRLVLEMQRQQQGEEPRTPEIDPDLLLGQMFGALDRIRLQMSADLLYLESFLGRYAQSARTSEILQAFQRLLQMQGGLANPSPGLASVLDWLQASSFRMLRLDTAAVEGAALDIPRPSDLLREAYHAARPASSRRPQENRP